MHPRYRNTRYTICELVFLKASRKAFALTATDGNIYRVHSPPISRRHLQSISCVFGPKWVAYYDLPDFILHWLVFSFRSYSSQIQTSAHSGNFPDHKLIYPRIGPQVVSLRLRSTSIQSLLRVTRSVLQNLRIWLHEKFDSTKLLFREFRISTEGYQATIIIRVMPSNPHESGRGAFDSTILMWLLNNGKWDLDALRGIGSPSIFPKKF